MRMLCGYRLGASARKLRYFGRSFAPLRGQGAPTQTVHQYGKEAQHCPRSGAKLLLGGILILAFAACTTRLDNAPIADRSPARQPMSPPPPGYYRVKPGDTLYRIALDSGQNYHDIAT